VRESLCTTMGRNCTREKRKFWVLYLSSLALSKAWMECPRKSLGAPFLLSSVSCLPPPFLPHAHLENYLTPKPVCRKPRLIISEHDLPHNGCPRPGWTLVGTWNNYNVGATRYQAGTNLPPSLVPSPLNSGGVIRRCPRHERADGRV